MPSLYETHSSCSYILYHPASISYFLLLAAFARLWGLVDGNIDPVGGWPTALQWLIEFCEGYIQTGAEFGWPVTSPGTGGNNSLVRDEGRALLALTGYDVPFMVGRIRGA
ncbi:hypothetical protein N7472_009126 [Penicillium cf. griseofulvum]|uniref:Uncharacterized protein n=1 Tax=Penicillium cf. griseofulvum TaxID=2972120 RepID=A0A9W9LZV8_9EURO|nr:hypothetical protein N7472_009126 [Penicillium cf. griseofulvum]